MIVFNCPKCGKDFRTKDEYAGRQFNCAACGNRFVLPKANESKNSSADETPHLTTHSTRLFVRLRSAASSFYFGDIPKAWDTAHKYISNLRPLHLVMVGVGCMLLGSQLGEARRQQPSNAALEICEMFFAITSLVCWGMAFILWRRKKTSDETTSKLVRRLPPPQFEISKRIKTNVELHRVIVMLDQQLSHIAASVKRCDGAFVVSGVDQTFGSINRSDVTTVRVSKKEDGYLCVAEVRYRPSFFFWVFVVLGFWTLLGVLIPILFYFHQKNLVRQSFESVFSRLSDEFHEDTHRTDKSERSVDDEIAAVERLARLRDSGAITDTEFQVKKRKILGTE